MILKEGAINNLLVGTHLSSNKLILGSLTLTVSPRTAKIPDISHHIIVSTLCTFQRENQEIRETQKRTESQLTQLKKMLQRITSQPAQSPSPIPLPSQPLPNPKGGINVFHNKEAKGEKDEDENEEGSVGWWYNLLAQLVDSNDEEDEESEDESKEEDEDESAEEDSEDESSEEEEEEEEEEESEDEEEAYNKGTSFIALSSITRKSEKRSL
ncbi:hypothetical protein PIB30_092696 [Stylosanthes scabra]|uniref:Uncharacterized protein n=1 Tax=Stylosanthes scabra TaxID=79078 RepID=A0ABU6YTR3_9FABA|nr:hypothetical protein [Stylosanthes scabra]